MPLAPRSCPCQMTSQLLFTTVLCNFFHHQLISSLAHFSQPAFFFSHRRCSPCSRTATSRRIETVPFPCFCTMYNSRIQVTIRSAPSPLPLLWLHTGSLPLYTPPSTHSFPRSNSVTYHHPQLTLSVSCTLNLLINLLEEPLFKHQKTLLLQGIKRIHGACN